MELLLWIIGLLFALVVGHVVVGQFLTRLRKRMGLPDERTVRRYRVPAAITGLVERTFFVVLVAGDVGGAGAIMIGWLATKIAANWGQPVAASQEDEARYLQIGFAFSALIAGLLSMLFALVGGLIAGGKVF